MRPLRSFAPPLMSFSKTEIVDNKNSVHLGLLSQLTVHQGEKDPINSCYNGVRRGTSEEKQNWFGNNDGNNLRQHPSCSQFSASNTRQNTVDNNLLQIHDESVSFKHFS